MPDFQELFEFCESVNVPAWFACDESRRGRLRVFEIDENLYVQVSQAHSWLVSAHDRIRRAKNLPLNHGPSEVQLSMIAGGEPLD